MSFTFAELYEIYAGEVASLEDFIALHRSKKDRPDTWFHQQDHRIQAGSGNVLQKDNPIPEFD